MARCIAVLHLLTVQGLHARDRHPVDLKNFARRQERVQYSKLVIGLRNIVDTGYFILPLSWKLSLIELRGRTLVVLNRNANNRT
jgi:hypothetical protein